MRINVYAEEITNEIDRVSKVVTGEDGKPAACHAIRLYLRSALELHHTPDDDDRPAITLWLPRDLSARVELAIAFRAMAAWAEDSWPGGWPGRRDGPEHLAVKADREQEAEAEMAQKAASLSEQWARGQT